MYEYVGIIGAVVGVIGLIYAIYINRQRAKLIDYNREQAWENYRQSLETLARYQEIDRNKINDKDIIESLARGETAATELARNSIRMIKRFEKKFDIETINSWQKEGRFHNESQVDAFKKLIY